MLAWLRFVVSVEHASRKFLKNQYPNDDSARRAAVAFEKHACVLLQTFDNMKGKATTSKLWGRTCQLFCVWDMHSGFLFGRMF